MRHAGTISLRVVGLAASLALATAGARAQDIQADYDRSYDFSKL